MRSSNPILSAKVFNGVASVTNEGVMTVQGTVNKTLILFALLLVSAAFVWSNLHLAGGFMMVGLFGGLAAIFAMMFRSQWAPVIAPIYAVLEGLVVGGLSGLLNAQYPGIVMQAVLLTFSTLLGMLAAYKFGLIKVTDKFRNGLMGATFAVFIVYMLSMVLGFFGVAIPLIHSSGLMGIGFSLLVIGIAALNLVLDFDFIEKAAAARAPAALEWYGAFGLMVTLIWLYFEILRLLSKLQRR